MNANEISSKLNPGLSRIKRVSRIVRFAVLVNLAFSVLFFFLRFPDLKFALPELSLRSFLNILLEGFVVLWFWELCQLFGLYEHGLIFAAQTIRCIRKLGILCLCGWLVMLALHFTPRPATGSQLFVVTRVEYDPFLSLYPFHIPIGNTAGIDFGLLIVGAAVVLAAWIMEEGRKLKDEQELTV